MDRAYFEKALYEYNQTGEYLHKTMTNGDSTSPRTMTEIKRSARERNCFGEVDEEDNAE